MARILLIPSIGVEIPPKRGGAIELTVWELAKNIITLWRCASLVILTISTHPPYNVRLAGGRLHIVRIPVPKGHNTHLICGLIKYLVYLIFLVTLMIKQKYDIVNVHYNIYAPVAAILAKLRKAKVILTLHIPHVKSHHIYLRRTSDRIINAIILSCERLAARFSDVIVATSKFVREQFNIATSNGYSQKTIVIPLGTYIEQCKPEYISKFLERIEKLGYDTSSILKTKIISYIGRIIEYKNVHKLILAAKALYEKYNVRDFTLIIAGPSMKYGYKKLYDYVETLNKYVHFLKRKYSDLRIIFIPEALSEEEKKGLLCLSKVFALPSVSEGFGLVALEAMAYGVPVIISYIDALKELLPDDLEWLYLYSITVDELAAKIKRLIDLEGMENLNIRYKLRCRAAECSWLKIAEMYIKLIVRVLKTSQSFNQSYVI